MFSNIELKSMAHHIEASGGKSVYRLFWAGISIAMHSHSAIQFRTNVYTYV